VGLSEALEQEMKKARGGVPCSVCSLIRTIGDDDRAALMAAMENESMFGSAIARALEREGHEVTAAAISRHRRGGCKPR
jgi:hypothetical protein